MKINLLSERDHSFTIDCAENLMRTIGSNIRPRPLFSSSRLQGAVNAIGLGHLEQCRDTDCLEDGGVYYSHNRESVGSF